MMRKANLCLIAAAVMMLGTVNAYAEQSPSFAYSAEEWASLRDNNLEYNEIAKLVHEYNPTVLKNVESMKAYVGKSSSDISQNYYDSADRILGNLSYPDESSPNYAQGVSSYLNSQISYENMMEQGDNNTNDEETYRLNYAQQEANLVKQAKQKMISYWTAYYNMESLRNNVVSAEQNLNSVVMKIQAGTAVESAKGIAEQSLTNARTALETAENNLKTSKEELCLMLGWSYGADAEIGAVPLISDAEIDAIDLAADIEKAKTNNYSLRTTNRQLNNAKTDTVRNQLSVTKTTSETSIAKNVSDLYTAIQKSRTELAAARDTFQVQTANYGAAERKKAAGMMTEKDFTSAKNAYAAANAQIKIKEIAVLNAYENYQSAVNGLAAVN